MKQEEIVAKIMEHHDVGDVFDVSVVSELWGYASDDINKAKMMLHALHDRGYLERQKKGTYKVIGNYVKSCKDDDDTIRSLFEGHEDVYGRLVEEAKKDFRSIHEQLLFCVWKTCWERKMSKQFKVKKEKEDEKDPNDSSGSGSIF
jgi:hypothetical protein